MMPAARVRSALLIATCCACACSENDDTSATTTAGTAGTGGLPTGGAATGGAATGGAATGGTATGGTATGGAATGGTSTGGAATGGTATGGTEAGGAATGGTATGGAEAGGAGTGSGGSGGSVATCAGSDWTSGDQSITLTHDGIERSYEVHIPASYSGTASVPLMLVIHGAHNTPWMARSWSQMDPVADENGFIVAYPAGLDCWNTGMILPGCTAADDDFGFILSVVDDIESHACIDQKRVYATGISNGSMMAQYMGCQAADVFASVGGVAAGLFGSCAPSRPISVFYVHGTADTTVAYSPNAVDGWINVDHCDSPPVEAYSAGAATCDLSRGCDDGVEVEFCTVEGMEHCWPDNCYQGSYGSEVFEASPLMWEFFARHPMP